MEDIRKCREKESDRNIPDQPKIIPILPHLYPHIPNHPLSTAQPPQPVLACQPGPRTTGTPDAEMVACKEAEQVALAELNKYLLASTYKMDFHGKGENGVSMSKDVIATLKPSPKCPLHTTMRQDYQVPLVLASLRNKTSRYGYKDRTVASGPVPAIDSDMCRGPEYTRSRYMHEFVDPSKRYA